MLHAKYEDPSLNSLGQEDLKIFFHYVAMATRVLHGIQFFEAIWRAWPKDHFCEVSLKSDC